MKGLEKRGNIWRVRIAIPADLRPAWGKREEIVSLNTSDDNDAIVLAAPVIAGIKRRIIDLRSPAQPVPRKPSTVVRLTIPQTFDAIRGWRHASIENDYLDAFNGTGATHDGGADSTLRYRLQHNSTIGLIEDFDQRLADILDLPVDHPVIQRANVREWMRKSWADVEGFRERFARDDFNGWPEDLNVAPVAQTLAAAPVAKAGLKLSALRDAWDAKKPLSARQKGYIRRLIEYLGDVDIVTIEPLDMDRFLVELKRFPFTKRPSDERLSFTGLIALYEGTDQPRLHVKTIWNWTTVYKGLFAFAVSRRLLAHNPAEDMMKKPTAEEANERDPYSEADLDFIFTRPLFKGFSGPTHTGYRAAPGTTMVKDSKYWLPIVALHTGMRLEELASLRTDEILDENGVLAFDLRKRKLTGEDRVKNTAAKRIVPIHHRLFDLGFVTWLQSQDGFVFPGLTTKGSGKRGPGFGKWWGLWCTSNAETKGQGIDDQSLTFHSFRHSFKRAARQSTVKEEIHDLISGHKEGNSVARGYGAGVDLATLKAAMDQIDIRWP